jgi:hypothetical protein
MAWSDTARALVPHQVDRRMCGPLGPSRATRPAPPFVRRAARRLAPQPPAPEVRTSSARAGQPSRTRSSDWARQAPQRPAGRAGAYLAQARTSGVRRGGRPTEPRRIPGARDRGPVGTRCPARAVAMSRQSGPFSTCIRHGSDRMREDPAGPRSAGSPARRTHWFRGARRQADIGRAGEPVPGGAGGPALEPPGAGSRRPSLGARVAFTAASASCRPPCDDRSGSGARARPRRPA